MNFKLRGNIVDIPAKRIFYGEVTVENGKILSIHELQTSNPKHILSVAEGQTSNFKHQASNPGPPTSSGKNPT